MPLYYVRVQERWENILEIEADSEQDAIQLVREGHGNEQGGSSEYVDMMDSETWDVWKADEEEESL